jgi:hypothetical protein
MRKHLGNACATIAMLVGMMGCGSYSAPDDSGNSPMAPDSTTDSTPAPPPPGYLQS